MKLLSVNDDARNFISTCIERTVFAGSVAACCIAARKRRREMEAFNGNMYRTKGLGTEQRKVALTITKITGVGRGEIGPAAECTPRLGWKPLQRNSTLSSRSVVTSEKKMCQNKQENKAPIA